MTPRRWFVDRNGIDWPTVLLAVLAIAVVLALLVAATTSSAAFGLYNPSWDGTSEFRDDVESQADIDFELSSQTNRYDETGATDTVAFVLAPDSTYSEADAARVKQFVESGGTLVVLDNADGAANQLLADLGAEARLDGRLLLETREYDRGPAMPIATSVEPHARTTGVEQLALNYATPIEPSNATVLVSSSEYAYLGESDAAELDDNASLATHPVATTEPVGDGEVVVVGDASIAINVMYDEPDNGAFLQAQYANTDRVLFDLSHAGDVPPLVGAVELIRTTPLLQALLGLVAVAGVGSISTRRLTPHLERLRDRLSRSPRLQQSSDDQRVLSDAEQAAYLRQQYPEWDEERIQRVIAALNRTRSKREDR